MGDSAAFRVSGLLREGVFISVRMRWDRIIRHTKMVVEVLSQKDIRKKWFRNFFVTGVVLLVGSLVMWLTPTVVLGGIDSKINSRGLHGPLTETQQKMVTDLQWSKIWWEMKQITVFIPTSIILLVFGMVLIFCGLVERFSSFQ